MLTRMRKEMYVLWPYFALSLALEAWMGWYLYVEDNFSPFTAIPSLVVFYLQIAVLHVASVVPFSVEFREGVCDRLFSMPVSRVRLFYEKTTILFLMVSIVVCIDAWRSYGVYLMYQTHAYPTEIVIDFIFELFLLFGMAGVLVVFTGPLLTIYLKRGFAALWASAVVSGAFFIILFCVNEWIDGYPKNKELYEGIMNSSFVKPIFQKVDLALPFTFYMIPWCAAAFLFARRLWKRLEV